MQFTLLLLYLRFSQSEHLRHISRDSSQSSGRLLSIHGTKLYLSMRDLSEHSNQDSDRMYGPAGDDHFVHYS
jgi:hypothetical protein